MRRALLLLCLGVIIALSLVVLVALFLSASTLIYALGQTVFTVGALADGWKTLFILFVAVAGLAFVLLLLIWAATNWCIGKW